MYMNVYIYPKNLQFKHDLSSLCVYDIVYTLMSRISPKDVTFLGPRIYKCKLLDITHTFADVIQF